MAIPTMSRSMGCGRPIGMGRASESWDGRPSNARAMDWEMRLARTSPRYPGRDRPTARALVVDPFAGSGNTLYWLLRHLPGVWGVGFESDAGVFRLTRQNMAALSLPIDILNTDYLSGLTGVSVAPDELLITFIAPPWGDALGGTSGLDLRKKPRVPESSLYPTQVLFLRDIATRKRGWRGHCPVYLHLKRRVATSRAGPGVHGGRFIVWEVPWRLRKVLIYYRRVMH
jgi:hypothetical protein